ncbi:sugar ABC transporter ATP-binding protein [Arachidicoccus terrestris]|uniref:sugar ABC transporter ATP-binding protein n=1 Tax=Arachidicoccus terrestris TaxID=2875539 RepID=UPI001CC48D34|nr:sugar ABC transporter ATP-binding protein [Arachidicoccus terrestris]UAY54012.1 sugar ABC transporter ATP-binding protein [Arachidicoccus terrestris]
MLIAKNITKRFSGVTALDNVNLELQSGKVTAIIGENGAGKSTLMKILSGVYTQYEGDIIFNSQKVQFNSTKEAEDTGIAIIHQELNLVPYLTITQNIFLGRELLDRFGLLDKAKMQQETQKLLRRVKLDVRPDALIHNLKVGQQQLIEIAKALHSNAEVIIMDEPTSAITDKEVENLFVIINELRRDGKTVAYISHKLRELFQIADNYTVLRDGTTVGSGEIKNITQDELVEKMSGRKIRIEKNVSNFRQDQLLLELKGISLSSQDNTGNKLVDNIDFGLYKGEIVGIYGLMGAGRTELMETIFGLHPKSSTGEIRMESGSLKFKSPADAINAGIMLIPEDRKLQGLFLGLGVRPNISITILQKLQRFGFLLNRTKDNAVCRYYIHRLSIKTHTGETLARNLSGGNQQKIVLAKWLAKNPKVLLLDEPTRGIDVGAKSEIYKLIRELAAGGVGVIVVSSEIPEILAVANRVLVMCEGRLSAEMPVAEATESNMLRYAIYHTESQ